ncbi:MAG: GmrSD restriction endonuclease domain-containing protein [Nitrosotalea sp.]
MSDSFKTNPWTLEHLLNSIDTGQIVVPEFQRSFVWDPNTSLDLVISISNNYPAGSLLFYKQKKEPVLPYRPIEGVNKTVLTPEHLVLDGQQRLTSLYQIFYGKGKHRFFVNLTSLQNGNDFEESVFNENADRAQKQFGESHKQFETNTLPLTCMFDRDMNFDRWLDAYLDYKKLEESKRKETRTWFRDMHEKYLKSIERYSFPVVELNPDTELEAICKIFEALNIKGIKLTAFEILTAKLYPDKINLRTLWEEANKNNQLMSQFLKDDEATYVLKTITLLLDKTPKSCKRKDILNLKSSDINNYWDSAVKYIEKSLAILKNECGVISRKWLPYITILPPMAAALYNLETTSKGAEIGRGKKMIERWFWCNVFSQRYDQATDTKSSDEVVKIDSWIKKGIPLDFIEHFSFDPSELRDIQSAGNAIYAGVICLLIQNDALDFHNRTKISTLDIVGESIDDHHVFPSAYLKEKKIERGLIDCILNKTLIHFKTNQTIGKQAPSKYLKTIETVIGKSELEQILTTHKLISPWANAIFKDDFQKFLDERQQMIYSLINDVTR